MHGIAPPDFTKTYKCGERDWLTGKLMLCYKCRLLEPDERPSDCPETVVVDLGIKY
jgi:hypothetical protein